MSLKEVFISETNCVTPLGFDVHSNWEAILRGETGIKQDASFQQSAYISKIDEDLINQKFTEISKETHYSKLEKMLILALHPIVSKHNIDENTPLIVSSTKGNIDLLDLANPSDVLLGKLAKKVAHFFGFKSEPIVISNACVSGLLAVSVAKRMIQSGFYKEAFIVAGDIVTEFVLSGFHSFQAVSALACKPYDKDRNGISLGEASAAAFITSEVNELSKSHFKIIGDGSINDANHISGPSRTGEGLYKSIAAALKEAEIEPSTIDCISAHGTATVYNDEMEAIALNRLALQNVPLNSLKGYYGHTLGASGLLETVLSMESAKHNQLIPSKGISILGVSKPLNVIQKLAAKNIKYFLKTASGFGGCNTAVLFKKMN